MKREISVGVFRVRGPDRSGVQGDVNLWTCLTWRVDWEIWEEDAEMWTDPEKAKRSEMGWVLVGRKWAQGKDWMVSSSVGRE